MSAPDVDVDWPPVALPGTAVLAGVGAIAGVSGVTGGTSPETGYVLDAVRGWLARFVCTMDEADLDLLTLWAAHTHLCVETYTSPRLVLDSPVPGSGKTTVLEHLERLCLHPVQIASLGSPALLTRMLAAGMRTVLIDEADRSLSPDKEGIGELIAVLNSGYKRGSTRPVLVPNKESGWVTEEHSTFAPVAMAGNNPALPEDTRSRSIRVLLMPDLEDRVEESDWELIEDEARVLGADLATWAEQVREQVREQRPPLPPSVKGRARERWSPLKRVAAAAGGRWPGVVDVLAVQDVQRIEDEREEGIVQQRPAVALLGHIAEVWPEDEPFVPVGELIRRLVAAHPETWGAQSGYGSALTPQRLGRMLTSSYNLPTIRVGGGSAQVRGYRWVAVAPILRRFGIIRRPESGGSPVTPLTPAMAPTPATYCMACGTRMVVTQLGQTAHPACEGTGRGPA